MAQYIDFIELMPSDRVLVGEFKKMIKKSSADELSSWFMKKGYQVTIEECSVILDNNRHNFYLMDEAIPYLFISRQDPPSCYTQPINRHRKA